MKKRLQGFLVGILVCSLFLSIPVFAAGVNKTIKAVFNSVTVKLDGKVVSGDKINYNKNVYISAKSVSDLLGKDYKVDKNGNISFSSVKTSNLNSQLSSYSVGNGNISGTITWEYNDFVGNKPDTKAYVILISVNAKKGEADNVVEACMPSAASKPYPNIYGALVNGKGDFKIQNVKAGDYHLVIISANTHSAMETSETIDLSKLEISKFFSDESKIPYEFKYYKYVINKITIVKNQTYDYSWDFGYTSW